jgi:hypothetical protein
MLGRIGLDLGAVQGNVPKLHQSRLMQALGSARTTRPAPSDAYSGIR